MIEQVVLGSGVTLLVNEKYREWVHQEWFKAGYWQERNALDGTAKGRNLTYFFHHNAQGFVLRHYYRGGLIGKFNKDKYGFTALSNTRVLRELRLLQALEDQGLPVPVPVAGIIKRVGLVYTADIIIEKIDGAEDLFTTLQRRTLTGEEWCAVGSTIAQFHEMNVFHADLNIHNIMMDKQGKIWLIDFDRGLIKPSKTNDKWKNINLLRLLRSLKKEKSKGAFFWQEQDWEVLEKAYLSGSLTSGP